MNKKAQLLFLFFIVLISLRFFDATFLNKSFVNNIVFFTLLFIAFLSTFYFFQKQRGFVLPVQLIIVSIIISILPAHLSWGQSFKDSIIATSPYLVWMLFFYLVHVKTPIKTIENIVLTYGAIYTILYFYQFAHSPRVLFGWSLSGDEFTENRGITRIIFPGGGIFILSVFIAVNKLTTQANKRWLWLLFTLLGIIIPILQATRQFIAGIAAMYLIHFLKGQKMYKKIMVASLFLSSILLFNYSDIQVIKGMREASQSDLKEGDNYVRVQAGTYFLTDFSPNNINKLIGNGVSNYGFSYYGLLEERLAVQQGFYLSDVGIIAVYAMFGIVCVIGYLLIWVKSFTIPVPKEFYYLKYYLWYLLLTSFTWFGVYYYHYLISTVLVLYIYHTLDLRSVSQPSNA